MNRLIYILCFILSASSYMNACSCAGQPDFCTTMTGIAPPDILVKGVKVEDIYYGMQFRITEVLLGEESRELVTVWGDNGALCRVYTSGFNLEDTLILGLHHTDMAGNWITNPAYPPDLEQEEDYHLSVCGVYFLLVEDGWVSEPPFIQDPFHLPYDDFLELACLTTGFVPVLELSLQILPNPASDNISIILENGPGYLEGYTIFDALGRKVAFQELDAFYRTLEIPLNSFPGGLYFIFVSDGISHVTRKIFIMRDKP